MIHKILKRWIFTLLLIYLSGGIAFYFLQNALFFHPVQLKKNDQYNFTEPHKEINIPIDNETNLNIIQFLCTDTLVRGVILYFHGNTKNISSYAKYAPYFTQNNYEVWMIDYPGFGKSIGKFNEQTLYDWALRLYRFAHTRFFSDKIIIYGKSMGTGIAAQLASVRDCKQLILETPYYDFPSLVKHYLPIYPIQWLIHYKLPTYQYLQNVTAPTTIFHGTEDGVIPYKNTRKLQIFLKKEDKFITIQNGHHNDLYNYAQMTQTLDSLLMH